MFTHHYAIAGAGAVVRAYLCALETLRSREFGSVVVTPATLEQAIVEGLFCRCADPDVLGAFVQKFEARLKTRKVRASGRAWTGIYDAGEGSAEGGWTPVDRLEGDPLRAVDGVATERARRQAQPSKGDVVERLGRTLEIVKVGSAVEAEDVATGETVVMPAERFFGRRLQIVEPDPAMQQPIKPVPVTDRAWAIASSEVVGVRKILDLYKLRRETEKGDDGWLACTWYIGQLKRGEKPRRWKRA